MQNRTPTTRPVLDFAPVPRKFRVDGCTADRQRAFVAEHVDDWTQTEIEAWRKDRQRKVAQPTRSAMTE